MMAIDSVVLFFLRMFRSFTRLEVFETENVHAETQPHATEATKPEKLGIVSELMVDGSLTPDYRRKEPIYFDPETPYSDLEGVVTFRGNHLRSGGSFGTANIVQRKLHKKWSVPTGRLKKGYGKGYWTGSGWTGQPLIVRWTDDQKRQMNLFEQKKQKPGLTEVVYSTMDGKVYFLDLEDGSKTREEISVGLPFKGAGALNPNGDTPMVFLGPGDSGPEKEQYARAYIYSLINGEKLYEYGGKDPFALRIFHGFDSSPLVDSKTDTLIEPSENGILYTMKLNTNMQDGKLSIAPEEIVKLRYETARSSEESYWLGMEDSAVVWKNYLYIADNGGNLLCIDLNTMKIVWAQDVADDTNGSPVFSMEDGVPYLYIATSLHWTASRRLKLGDVPLFKINAITGEYVWKRSYLCNTVAGISGGVQATPVVGRGNIENLVIFPIARTPSVRGGRLVAFDKKTGKEVWNLKMKRYAWSSPVAVYDDQQRAYLIQCDSVGNMFLIDGATGSVLDSVFFDANIEATPAVFGNTVVVGTRGQEICGVEIQ